MKRYSKFVATLALVVVLVGALELAAGFARAAEPSKALSPLTQLLALTGTAETESGSATRSNTSSQASSNGENSIGESPVSATTVTVAFAEGDNTLVMPYGVDPVAWANANLVFDVSVDDGTGVPETITMTAADLGVAYFGGADPIVAAADAFYPENQADETGALTKAPDWERTLTFASAVDVEGRTVTLPPDLSGLGATVSWTWQDPTIDPTSVDKLPLAPASVFADLSGTRADGSSEAPLAVTGSWVNGDLAVWLNADDLAEGMTPISVNAGGLTLSDTFNLVGTGEFSSLKAAQAFDLDDAATLYTKLTQGVTEHTANEDVVTLVQGEVVRVPVHKDTQAPTIGETLVVTDGSGTEVSPDTLTDDNGNVVVTSSGLLLTVTLADEAGDGELASGLAPTATLTLENESGTKTLSSAITTIAPDSTATFEINPQTAAGTFNLSGARISVSDAAGNESVLTLANAKPFKDAESLGNLIVFDETAVDDFGAAIYFNNDAGDGQVTYLGAIDPSTSRLQLNNEPLHSLGVIATPKKLIIDDFETQLEAVDFATTGDALTRGFTDTEKEVRALRIEGRHTITFSYLIQAVTPLPRQTQRTIIYDTYAPVVISPSFDGVARPDKDVATMDDGTYLVGGSRDITLQLKDYPGGDSNQDENDASGLNRNSVLVHVERTNADGTTEGMQIQPDVDDEGNVTIHLTEEGVYKLSDITLSFSDNLHNSQSESLSTYVQGIDEWNLGGDTTMTGIVVATTSPEVDVVVDPVDGGKHTEVNGNKYYSPDARVTLQVTDPWFNYWRSTGRASSLFNATLTPSHDSITAQSESLGAPSVLDFNSGENDTWTCIYDLPKDDNTSKPFEGFYDFQLIYDSLNGDEKRDSATFTVDHTAPSVTDASLVGVEEEPAIAEMDSGERYLLGGDRTVKLRIQDLLRGAEPTGTTAELRDQPYTSGVDTGSITVTLSPERNLFGDAGPEITLTTGEDGGLSIDENGYVTVPLSSDGLYKPSNIEVSFDDLAGNHYEPVSLQEILNGDDALQANWSSGNSGAIDGIIVATTEPTVEVSLRAADGTPESDRADVYRGRVDVTLAVNDPWFGAWRNSNLADASSLLGATLTPGSAGVEAAVENLPLTREKLGEFVDDDHDGTWTFTYDNLPNVSSGEHAGDPVEGAYDFELTYAGTNVSAGYNAQGSASFLVDYTAPFATDAVLDGVDNARDVATMDDGVTYVVGSSRTVRVRFQDLLRGLTPAAATAGERDQPQTAGISVDSNGRTYALTVSLTRADGMGAGATTTTDTLGGANGIHIDGAGWVDVPLSAEGLYRLDDIVFTIEDEAGNSRTTTLAQVVEALQSERHDDAWKFGAHNIATGIIVDDPATAASAGVEVSDGTNEDGTPIPVSNDPYYHRGNTKVRVWVEDTWFDAYRHVPARATTFSNVSLRRDNGATSTEGLPQVNLVKMRYNAASNQWETIYDLPEASALDKRPAEGDYRIDLAYEGLTGTPSTPAVNPDPVLFGVDYSAPNFGNLELSRIEPAQWGMIFATDDEDITAGVTDNLSGVRGDSASVNPQGTLTSDEIPVNFTRSGTDYRDRDVVGALSFGFGTDASRLYFSGTTIHVSDIAGNETTVDMGSYVGHNSNIPASWDDGGKQLPYVGVSIDTVWPTIDVSFDNNDVRNEQYYNRARTASVTITESNFDLLQANDADRPIAVVGRDGSQGTALAAKDFSNPSGDGVTWVASYAFEDDADWTFDVSLTDPAYHEAAAYHTAFIIDTQAPSILVTWDNNDAANGSYFKAPRTASIQVMDRNFSPDFASATATAADASGAQVSAPGSAAWNEDESRQQWSSSLYFGNELHYTMRVEVTDLAGNAAEAYEEPEFIIDMTAPEVSIGGVSDRTAYSDVAAPTISYSDTNLDALMATYTLTGGRRGSDTYVSGVVEQATTTTKDITFPDFEHTLDNDDVYVLDAKIIDLAGNEAQQNVMFSVNRFGSNYILLDGSGSVLGSYLNKPQDIVVAEINASGLDEAKTHAELAHDATVSSLEEDSDFAVDPVIDDAAWSETTYTFPERLFASDGYYRIMLTSTDLAGNLSQNTMDAKNQTRDGSAAINFAIDTTPPSAGLIGIDSDGVYLNPNKTADVDAHDNLAVQSATLEVDGRQVSSWDDDTSTADLSQNLRSVNLPADDRSHDVQLTVTDKAGNKSTTTVTGVTVTADLVTYVLHTPRLLFAVVALAIALLALVVIGTVMILRHRRLTEQRRNPFGHASGGN